MTDKKPEKFKFTAQYRVAAPDKKNEKIITMIGRSGGTAHEQEIWGTCSSNVTVEDIENLFYPHFGGRDAHVYVDGTWRCVVHTD